MNSLVIPPSPNWYQTKIAACAPDNTLIYGSNSSLVIIKPAPYDRPADVSVLILAHLDRIVGLSLGPQWTQNKKQMASFGDDKTVKLWNMIDNTVVNSHVSHTISKSKLIGGTFAGEHKVISVSEDGLIVIWRINTNELVPIKHLLGIKVQVTAVSSCPHASWLLAFGLRNGLVVVADMRHNGSVMYKLRSHDHDVTDLTWCPVPLNIFPKKEIAREVKDSSEDSSAKNGSDDKGSSLEESTNSETSSVAKTKDTNEENETKADAGKKDASETEKVVDLKITDKVQENEEIKGNCGETEEVDTVDALPANGTHLNNCKTEEELIKAHGIDKKNLWVNLKHADDDEQPPNVEDSSRVLRVEDESFDFLKECSALKAKILDEVLDENVDENIKKFDEPAEAHSAPKQAPEDGQLTLEGQVTPEDGQSASKGQSAAEDQSVLAGEPMECQQPETPPTPSETKPVEKKQDLKKHVEAKEFLLASSAKGGCICIWRAGTDGRLQTKLNLPKSKSQGRNKRKGHQHRDSSAWIALNWISPDILLSSGCNGELFRWDLLNSKQQALLVHNDHPKQLFSMCSPAYATLALEKTQVKSEDLAVWTLGRDRNLIYTSLQKRSMLSVYPTLGCAVHVMTTSPIDPNRVALGFGDGSIRVWDLSKPHLQFITMSQINLKVGAKVLSLAWHPTEEYILAYGTDEGQVGHVNPGASSKAPVLFAQHFRSAIYKLEWAPIPGNGESMGLYACGEGTVGIFDVKNPIASPSMMPLPKKEFVTQLAWKPDFTKLALGCKSGTIYLLNPNHQVESTLYYQKKGISCLAWHPTATAEDEDVSKNHSWLASSTTIDTSIVIYNTDIKINEENVKELVVGELSGHVKQVNQIVWSPYKNGQLVTLSEDGTSVVWVDMKPVATFVNSNTDPLLAGAWSSVNENFIITGGRESSLRVWNIDDHPYVEQVEVDNLRLERKKLLQQFKGKKEDKVEEAGGKSKKAALFLNAAERQANIKWALEDCRLLFQRSDGEECNGTAKTSVGNNSVLDLFGGADENAKLLEEQGEWHKMRNKHSQHQHLALWRGNIGAAVKEAITDGYLTPWLISIAPMASFKLWQEACEAYAAQQIENPSSDPVEVVSYLLSCHKIDEAVDFLCERQFYREALALAKARKPDDPAVAQEIMSMWAKNALINGRFELAAQNFIALGQFEEAAKVLYKRSDTESLALAVDLAKRIDNPELLAAITHRFNMFNNNEEKLAALPTLLEATLKLCTEPLPADSATAEMASQEVDAQEVVEVE